ncbi:MAG: hypothetical protein QM790_16560 [Nibricoccus sp.]
MNRAADDHASLTSNTAGGFLKRVVYCSYLVSVAGTSIFGFTGLVQGNVAVLLTAVLALACALLARSWLRENFSDLEATDPEWDALVENKNARGSLAAYRLGELAGLLSKWETLESTRGSGAFDPWELQSVKHEIRALLRESDELRLALVGAKNG